jgi:hypothetical protein
MEATESDRSTGISDHHGLPTMGLLGYVGVSADGQ